MLFYKYNSGHDGDTEEGDSQKTLGEIWKKMWTTGLKYSWGKMEAAA